MPTIVGVKLRYAPKIVSFDAAGTESVPGDEVIVETERGVEIGHVVDVSVVDASEVTSKFDPISRVATAEDQAHAADLVEREREALGVYRTMIGEHKLDMKPVDVEFLFGDDKAVFYFVAEERVDFRELVRDLASRYRMRIDMRQIGVRDEARMVGGLGHCGQVLCCVRFAGDFQPVSIRMAKEQDLPLNPLKISGLCGRLMCCLRYEYDAYKDFKQRAPKKGTKVETPDGDGKITSFNTPREILTVRLAEGGSLKVPLEAMECPGGGCPCKVSAEALDALKAKETESGLTGPVPHLTESSPPRKRESGGQGRPGGRPERTERTERKQSTERTDAGAKAEGEKKEASSGGGKRGRRRRKPRGGSGGSGSGSAAPKQAESGGGQQGAGSGQERAATDSQQAGQEGSPGRRKRRRRSSGPKKDENAGA